MIHLPNKILISGKQGSGKSTLSKNLVKLFAEFGIEARQFRFASIIYEIHDAAAPILKKHGLWPKDSNGRHAEKDGDFLQVVGTEYGRNKRGQHVWSDKCLHACGDFTFNQPKHFAIVDDARFENEFDNFECLTVKVRLDCPEELRKKRLGANWRANTMHPSEVGLDAYAAAGRFDLRLSTDSETYPLCQFTNLCAVAARMLPEVDDKTLREVAQKVIGQDAAPPIR